MDSRGDLAHVLDPAPGIAESRAEQLSRAGAWIPLLGELEVDEGGGQPLPGTVMKVAGDPLACRVGGDGQWSPRSIPSG
jgi:hypothetical protein